jgi:hypothetical protein
MISKTRYLPDVFVSVVATVAGIIIAGWLHGKWYYGGWMGMLGDPPDGNPAYDRLEQIFTVAPYVAGGLTTGLISGFGYFKLLPILIRFTSVVIVFSLALSSNHMLTTNYFIPAALASFVFSTGISFVYFYLVLHHDKFLKARTDEWENMGSDQ